MSSSLEYKKRPYYEDPEGIIFAIKNELSELEQDKLSNEGAISYTAYGNDWNKVAYSSRDIDCSNAPFISFFKKRFPSIYKDLKDQADVKEDTIELKCFFAELWEKDFLQDSALLSLIKSPKNGQMLMAIPLMSKAMLYLPIEQYILWNNNERFSFELRRNMWEEFKQEAMVFIPPKGIYYHKVVSSEKSLLTIQEFLYECKQVMIRDPGRYHDYDTVVINIDKFSFIMPGRIIVRLDEIVSGLINKNPKYTSIIPQELKDTVPGATDEIIHNVFMNALVSLHIKSHMIISNLKLQMDIESYWDFGNNVQDYVLEYVLKEFYPRFPTFYPTYTITADKRDEYSPVYNARYAETILETRSYN